MSPWPTILVALLVAANPLIQQVRDPFSPVGYPPCQGGEIGNWQFIPRGEEGKKGHTFIYLILTEREALDPQGLICWVPPDARMMVMGPTKGASYDATP